MSSARSSLRVHVAVAVVGALGMLGASVLWIVLAPAQQWIVYPKSQDNPDGLALSLPLESYFRFTSIALFALLAIVVGVVMAVAAWQIRFARGTTMVLALAGGLVVGSALGLVIGRIALGGVDPAVLASQGVATPTMVQMPASISRLSVVVAPGVALLVYTLTAAWHNDPNLGRPRPSGLDRQPEVPGWLVQYGAAPVAPADRTDPHTAPIAATAPSAVPPAAPGHGDPWGVSGGSPTDISPAVGTPRTDP